MRGNKLASLAIAVVSIALASFFIVLLTIKVPPSMDEYLPYHQLACFINDTKNTFREGCTEYDLILFGKSLPLRAFGYNGFSNSLMYLPFYLLWKSYLSARLMKIIFLILTAVFAIKITKINWKIGTIVGLCFFPFAFQMISDTGPASFQCFLLVFLPWLFSRKSASLLDGILGGILIFLAIEQKPLFVPMLLPLAIFTILISDIKTRLRQKIKFIIGMLIPLAICLPLLLMAKMTSGSPYLTQLQGMSNSIPILDISAQISHLKRLSIFFTSFYNFAERIYGPVSYQDLWTACFYFVFLGAAVAAFFASRSHKKTGAFKIFWAAATAFLISVWLFGILKNISAGHHLVLILPFVLIAIMALIKIISDYHIAWGYLFAALFYIINLNFLIITVHFQPHPQDDWSRLELIDYTNHLNGQRAYFVTDWGIYHLLSLYATKGTPVYYSDLNPIVIEYMDNLRHDGYIVYNIAKWPPSFGDRFREIKYSSNNVNWHIYEEH